jgi:hypothetical protein
MSQKLENKKKLKQNLQIKNYTYPLLHFLDKTRLLPVFQGSINKVLNILKIKKQFNAELNYRTYAKLFSKAFQSSKAKSQQTILIPCFYPVNSTIFLRQMMLAKYIMNQGNEVLFIVCDGYFDICQMERSGKTREDFKYLCHECSHHYKFIKAETGLPLRFLSEFKHLVNLEDYKKNADQVNALTHVQECENFVTFDGIPLGKLNKIGMLRYFQKGKLDDSLETLSVYKKYLKDTYRTQVIFDNILKENAIHKTILWSGCSGHDQVVAYCSQQRSIDYITQEMYIGENSWIYKKNGIAIHLDYHQDWLNDKEELSFSEEQKQKVLQLFSGMKSGKTFSVTYNDSSKKLALDDQKKYVVLFTNMNFDMYVLGRNPIFESMKDWIRETIKFWRENVQDYTLIIRAHPGEIKLVTASTDFVSEVVDLKEGDNIIFYDSDSDVNSYDLMNVASYVLTYSSTIGAEALLSDIPCISAGETMYQHFCTSPKSKQAYFESIVAYNEGHFPEIDQENLLFYLHYLMFIKNVEIRGFKVNRKIGKVEFDESMRDYQDLINSNSSVLKNFYNQHIDN